MNVHHVAAGVIGSVMVLFGLAIFADDVGEALTSVWAVAAMAFAVFTVWLAVTARFWRRARESGYLHPAPSLRPTRWGKYIPFLVSVAYFSFGIYYILESKKGIDGNPDYFQSYLGGSAAALATVWIVQALRANYRNLP